MTHCIKLTFALVFGTFISQSAFALVLVSAGEGCSIYLPSSPKPGGQYKWIGQCAEGLATGDGVLLFTWKSAPYSETAGTAIRGYRTGLWVLTEANKTYEYALLMKEGVADSIAVREFPKGDKAKAIARAETIVELEKYAEKSNQQKSNTSPQRQAVQPSVKQNSVNSVASICGRSISWSATEVQKYPPSTTSFESTYEIVSEAPIAIRLIVNQFEPKNYTLEQSINEAERALGLNKLQGSFCNQIQFCREDTVGQEKTLAWLKCIASNNVGAEQTARAASQRDESALKDDTDQLLDLITPQVPGCPRYLRKSLVAWSKKEGANSQLNVWEIRNVSSRILKVTYRVDGVNSDSETLNPGDAAEVWRITERPPYVVRDFRELMNFNRKQPQQQALQCALAIRPR